VACPSCGASTEPGEKFCGGCGVALTGGRATVPPRAPATPTPKHLAEKILTSRTALEGERKQVTVLFADLKGSMELAEQMDPEAWSAIVQRFFRILAEGVERFEGFVDKFTGDGITVQRAVAMGAPRGRRRRPAPIIRGVSATAAACAPP
jgi:class 3 adenylate cyclase